MSRPSFLSRFGHLLGNSASAAKPKAESDEYKDPEKKEDETDEEHASRCKAAKAEWDKEHPDASSENHNDGDDQDEEERSRKVKATKAKAKGRRAEDDNDEAEMRGSTPIAEARERERERCAAIMAHPAAAVRPDMAAQLMSEPIPYWRAVGLLEASAAGHPPTLAAVATLIEPARPTLNDRLRDAPTAASVPVGRDEPGQPTGAAAAAQFALNASNKARAIAAPAA